MKIYFSASRYYRDDYESVYSKVIRALEKTGCQVLDNSLIRTSSGSFKMTDKERVEVYKAMVRLMDKADLCVFEASYPSTIHIGHEITMALEKAKPVIVLHTKSHEPILFKGMRNNKMFWVEYDLTNLEDRLAETIEEAKSKIDVRFNFFVPPKILAYLDWVAQKKKVPRSVFLRGLIEKQMKKDKEFRG